MRQHLKCDTMTCGIRAIRVEGSHMYKQDEPEVNLEQILEKINAFFKRFRIRGGGGGLLYGVLGLVLVAAVVWLGSGFYTVQPGEIAVLRMFGKFNSEKGPGLNWFFPSPIGTRAVVDVQEIRRLELGLRGAAPVPEESLMITGDENIVDVQLLVQYDIKDPRDFLFKVVDPAGATMKDAAETALRQVVGSRAIDDVLTIEKEEVQAETKALLQNLLDTYETGIRIAEVKLQNVNPPAQVQDAFDDVVRAREDKEKIIKLISKFIPDANPILHGLVHTIHAASRLTPLSACHIMVEVHSTRRTSPLNCPRRTDMTRLRTGDLRCRKGCHHRAETTGSTRGATRCSPQ